MSSLQCILYIFSLILTSIKKKKYMKYIYETDDRKLCEKGRATSRWKKLSKFYQCECVNIC